MKTCLVWAIVPIVLLYTTSQADTDVPCVDVYDRCPDVLFMCPMDARIEYEGEKRLVSDICCGSCSGGKTDDDVTDIKVADAEEEAVVYELNKEEL